MPLSPSPRIASIMSCRCIEGPQLVVTGAVGDRRMAQRAVLGGDDRERPRWFAAPRQDVEDQIVARRAGCQCLAHGRLDWLQAIGQRSEEHTSELQSLMRISYAVFCLKKKNSMN